MPVKKTTGTSATTKTTQKKTNTRTRKRVPTKPKPSVNTQSPEAQSFVNDQSKEPRDHIRNLRRVPLRLRFPGQKIKDGDRGYELQPRGDRGDIIRISDDERNSTYYSSNLGLTFEALTASEAREAISKQSVNEQTPVHPAMAMLRNELGQEYEEKQIQLEVPYEQQGKIVAHVTMDGQRVNVDRTQPRGASGTHPEIANVPGSQSMPDHGQQLTPEQLRDAVARDKTKQGPSAGLAGITKVTMEDVVKK